MDGKDEDGRLDNVVRLPREWVRADELVPVGPSARARAQEAEDAAAQAAASAAAADEDPGVESPKTVPAASDFWGEDAAAVQHAICADGAQPPEPAPQPWTRRRRPTLRLRAPTRLLPAPHLWVDRTRTIRIAATVGALLAAAAIAFGLIGRGNHSVRNAATIASPGQLVHLAALTSDVRATFLASRTATREAERLVDQRAHEAQLRHRRARHQPTAHRPHRRTNTTPVHRSVDTATIDDQTPEPPPEQPPTEPSDSGSAASSSSSAGSVSTSRVYGVGGLLGSGHAG